MLISLNQVEIETALKNHIGDQAVGLDLSQYDINIKLIAGRSGNGLRAEVGLVPLGTSPAGPAPSTENDATPPAAEEETETATEESEKVIEDFDFGDD